MPRKAAEAAALTLALVMGVATAPVPAGAITAWFKDSGADDLWDFAGWYAPGEVCVGTTVEFMNGVFPPAVACDLVTIPSAEPKLRTHSETPFDGTFLPGDWSVRLYIKAPIGAATVKVQLYKEAGDFIDLCTGPVLLGSGTAVAPHSDVCKEVVVTIPGVPAVTLDNERIYLRIEKLPDPDILKLCWDCATAASHLATPPFLLARGEAPAAVSTVATQEKTWGAIKSIYRSGD